MRWKKIGYELKQKKVRDGTVLLEEKGTLQLEWEKEILDVGDSDSIQIR